MRGRKKMEIRIHKKCKVRLSQDEETKKWSCPNCQFWKNPLSSEPYWVLEEKDMERRMVDENAWYDEETGLLRWESTA